MPVNNHFPIAPGERLSNLRSIIDQKGFARIIEAHSGLSGIIAETSVLDDSGTVVEYDGLWESSLTDSASKGLPDASIVGTESRLHTVNEILHVTRKPMIVDGDTGGEIPQFEFLVTSLERMGVSAVIVEDKVYPKRNSLDNAASQSLEIPEKFAAKIEAGKLMTLSDDFYIIARLESLIAGTGLKDALYRAQLYLDGGVDGIMIHSNRRDPDDLFAFVKGYNAICEKAGRRPILVSVPTTYNQHSEKDLIDVGFNVIIHANQLLRASHMAMKEVALQILEDGRSYNVDSRISPVKEVFEVVGHDRITEGDRARVQSLRSPVIVPAAGKDATFSELPKSLIKIGNKNILDFQIEALTKAGLKRTVIVRGHEGAQFDEHYATNENITFRDNPEHSSKGQLHSLMCAKEDMGDGFLLVYSDILVDHDILSRLAHSGKDIVLALDNSYKYHTHEFEKLLDLVVTKKNFNSGLRSLRRSPLTELVRIGKQLHLDSADSEFIGVAYFSENGARALRETYEDLVKQENISFHESSAFKDASFNDIFQELVDRGYPIHGLEVRQGWREIHTREDLRLAETETIELDQFGSP